MEGEEKDKFMQLALDYMSVESSESEGEDMVVHKPAWRSRGNVLTVLPRLIILNSALSFAPFYLPKLK